MATDAGTLARSLGRWRPPPARPRGLPRASTERLVALVMAGVVAVSVGLLVAAGRPEVALPLAMAIPCGVLVVRFPFVGLLAWVVVLPYFLQQPTAGAQPVLWLLHRALLPGLLLLIGLRHVLGMGRSTLRIRLGDWALVGFLALAVVNIVALSENPSRMIVAFYDKIALPIVAFWLVRAIRPGATEIRWLVAAGLWTILVQGAIGVLSWSAPGMLPAQWLGRAGERTVGTFGGPAPYTVTLVLFALLATHDHEAGGRLLRRVTPAIVALALFAVFLSLSRGSWLGAGLALVGLLAVYPRFVGRLLLVGVVVVTALGLGPLRDEIELAQTRVEDEATVAGRIVTNDAALRMITAQPLLGFGYGNFERFDEQFKRQVGDIPLAEGEGGSAHNTYLALAAENGLPALALYLAPVAWLLLATWRARDRLSRGSVLGWNLAIVLWLAVADQLVVTNFMDMLHAQLWGTTLYWLSLGLIAVAVGVDEDPEEAAGAPRWAADR